MQVIEESRFLSAVGANIRLINHFSLNGIKMANKHSLQFVVINLWLIRFSVQEAILTNIDQLRSHLQP